MADKSLAVEFKKPWNLLADFNSDSNRFPPASFTQQFRTKTTVVSAKQSIGNGKYKWKLKLNLNGENRCTGAVK
jgi:hypothetical protein